MEELQTAPPRPPFKVSGTASVRHLNVRKEGPDDEKILACDLKLEIKNVDRRLCAYFDDALEAFLWRGDSDALIARNAFLSPVAYGNEISSASVRIGSNHFVGCDVRKFALEPRDGGVMTLTCSVSVYPSTNDVSDLAKLVQDEANVLIEGPPDLFATESVGESASAPAPGSSTGSPGDDQDALYEKAVALVRANNKASISMVQRHLQIGYNRAAALLELMEQRGVVTAMDARGACRVIKS